MKRASKFAAVAVQSDWDVLLYIASKPAVKDHKRKPRKDSQGAWKRWAGQLRFFAQDAADGLAHSGVQYRPGRADLYSGQRRT